MNVRGRFWQLWWYLVSVLTYDIEYPLHLAIFSRYSLTSLPFSLTRPGAFSNIYTLGYGGESKANLDYTQNMIIIK